MRQFEPIVLYYPIYITVQAFLKVCKLVKVDTTRPTKDNYGMVEEEAIRHD